MTFEIDRTFDAWKDREYPTLTRRRERDYFRRSFPAHEWELLLAHWMQQASVGQLKVPDWYPPWDANQVEADWHPRGVHAAFREQDRRR